MMPDSANHPAARLLADLEALREASAKLEAEMGAVGARMAACHLELSRLVAQAAAIGVRKAVVNLQLLALGVDA